jgi:hypothetical protein
MLDRFATTAGPTPDSAISIEWRKLKNLLRPDSMCHSTYIVLYPNAQSVRFASFFYIVPNHRVVG